MSATFNTDLFASFFQPGIHNESIFVGTRRFPVSVYFLEDIFDINALSSPLYLSPVSRASLQKLSVYYFHYNIYLYFRVISPCQVLKL